MTEQRLTDEQIAEISYSCMHPAGPRVDNFKFARAIEAAILSADRGEEVTSFETWAAGRNWASVVHKSCARDAWLARADAAAPTPQAAPEPPMYMAQSIGLSGYAQSRIRESTLATPAPDTVQVPREPTPEMASAYLLANTEYWHETDKLPSKPGVWRVGTPTQAFVAGYRAMIAAAQESKE